MRNSIDTYREGQFMAGKSRIHKVYVLAEKCTFVQIYTSNISTAQSAQTTSIGGDCRGQPKRLPSGTAGLQSPVH